MANYTCECGKTITSSKEEMSNRNGKKGTWYKNTNYFREYFKNKPSDLKLVYQIDKVLDVLKFNILNETTNDK